jgi:rhodanese-related sulfurtransferase
MKINRFPALPALLMSFFALAAASDMNAQQTNAPAKPAEPKNAPRLVEPTEAQKLIAEKKVVVLDVRMPSEYAAGHIAGATNVDFRDKDFAAKIAKLDKNQAYLVHCAAGIRSAKACEAMDQLDFKTLYDLKGGLGAWSKAGLPVEK